MTLTKMRISVPKESSNKLQSVVGTSLLMDNGALASSLIDLFTTCNNI